MNDDFIKLFLHKTDHSWISIISHLVHFSQCTTLVYCRSTWYNSKGHQDGVDNYNPLEIISQVKKGRSFIDRFKCNSIHKKNYIRKKKQKLWMKKLNLQKVEINYLSMWQHFITLTKIWCRKLFEKEKRTTIRLTLFLNRICRYAISLCVCILTADMVY